MEEIIYKKKDLCLLLIAILKQHTNKNDKLKINDFKEKLLQKYKFESSTKTIEKTLKHLIELDSNIKYTIIKTKKNGAVEYSDYWYESEYNDGLLRYLIDTIKSNKGISLDDKIKICNQLKKLSNSQYLKKPIIDEFRDDYDFEINEKYLYNISKINEAISLKKQIKFNMQVYNIDKDFQEVTDINNNPKNYIVIPKDLVIKEGEYYLIASFANDKKYNFRVDKIKEVKILDDKQIIESTSYKEDNIDDYVDKMALIYSGKVIPIKVKILDDKIIDKLVTEFDRTISFTRKENEIIATIKTNEAAFDIWIKKYETMIEKIK